MDFGLFKQKFDARKRMLETIEHKTADILSQAIDVPIHSINHRLKKFDSFYEKISRKNYADPFKECTDLIGFRVICLFKNQVEYVMKNISEHFTILETLSKEKKSDTFSYRSIHIVVMLKDEKYADQPIEIQIRTILEEAWAEIEHHLNYKQIGIDDNALRKINALSALFEIADDQFQQIYDDFISKKSNPENEKQITPESLYHYCKKTFPWAWNKPGYFNVEKREEYQKIAERCALKRLTSIKDIDELYKKYRKDVENYEKKHIKDVLDSPQQWPQIYKKVKETGHFFSPVLILSMMIKDLK